MRRRWSPIFCLFEKLSNCTYSRYFHSFGRRIYSIHHNNCMCNLSWNNLENTTDNACRSIFHMMTKIHSRRTIGKYGVIWCLFKAGTKSIYTNKHDRGIYCANQKEVSMTTYKAMKKKYKFYSCQIFWRSRTTEQVSYKEMCIWLAVLRTAWSCQRDNHNK